MQLDSTYAVYFHAYKLLFPKIYHQILVQNFPLTIPVFIRHIKIPVNGSELGRTTTNEGSGVVAHHINEAPPNPPRYVYLYGMKHHLLLQHHQIYWTRTHQQTIIHL